MAQDVKNPAEMSSSTAFSKEFLESQSFKIQEITPEQKPLTTTSMDAYIKFLMPVDAWNGKAGSTLVSKAVEFYQRAA